MLRILTTWCVLGVLVCAADETSVTARTKTPIELFNGRNFDGWYSYLEKAGKDHDPRGNFQVVDGVIRIVGQDFGYIATKETFDNYRLKLEFRWGTLQFAPRETGKRDSGVLFHFTEGEPDKVWPKSIECQIQETDTGDIWCVGTDVATENRAAQEWGMKRVFRTADFERPNGEWNTVEIIADNATIAFYVNGHLVNQATHASVRRGKILLQSEGAEVFYRNIELTPR